MHRILTLLLQREFLVPVRDSTPKMLAYLTWKLESVFYSIHQSKAQVSTFCILSPTYESGLLTVNAPFSEYSHIIAEIFRHEFSEHKPVCAALQQRCSIVCTSTRLLGQRSYARSSAKSRRSARVVNPAPLPAGACSQSTNRLIQSNAFL